MSYPPGLNSNSNSSSNYVPAHNTTTPSPHCAAQVFCGWFADTPRGGKRASRAPHDSKLLLWPSEVCATELSLCWFVRVWADDMGRSAPSLGHNTTLMRLNCAARVLRGVHKTNGAQFARKRIRTEWPCFFKGRAVDLSRCWCGRAPAEAVGKSAPPRCYLHIAGRVKRHKTCALGAGRAIAHSACLQQDVLRPSWHVRLMPYAGAWCRYFSVTRTCRLQIRRCRARVQRHTRAACEATQNTRNTSARCRLGRVARCGLAAGLTPVKLVMLIPYRTQARVILAFLGRAGSTSDVAALVSSATRAPHSKAHKIPAPTAGRATSH